MFGYILDMNILKPAETRIAMKGRGLSPYIIGVGMRPGL